MWETMEGESIPERLLDTADTASTTYSSDTSQARVNLAFESPESLQGSSDEAEKKEGG